MRSLLIGSVVLLLTVAVAFAHTPEEKKKLADAGPIVPSGLRALDCSGAISIDCDVIYFANNSGVPNNVEYYCGLGWPETGGEIVFVFDVTEHSTVTCSLAGNFDHDVFLLASCNEDDCLAYGDVKLTSPVLSPGTYYVVVDGYNGASGGFVLFQSCEPAPPGPENDLCEGAIDLCEEAVERDGSFNLEYSTLGAYDDYDNGATCTGYWAYGGDLVYTVCLEPGGSLEVTQTGNYDMSLYLITDCADPEGSCVAGSDECCTGADEYIHYTSTDGGTYYLIVDGYSNEGTGTIYGSVTGCCGTTATKSDSWSGVKKKFR